MKQKKSKHLSLSSIINTWNLSYKVVEKNKGDSNDE